MEYLACNEEMGPLELTEQEKIDRAEAAPYLTPLVPATPESPEREPKRARLKLPTWLHERRDNTEESSEEETEDLKDRLLYIRKSLEDRCRLRTQEGMDAMCEFGSPHSSQFSDFSLSQLSSSSQVSTAELRDFLESHITGVRFGEIESDPIALLHYLNVALERAYPELKGRPAKVSTAEEIQALVKFIDKVKQQCLLRVDQCELWMKRMMVHFFSLYYPGQKQNQVGDFLYSELQSIDLNRKEDLVGVDEIHDCLCDILCDFKKDDVNYNVLKEAINQYNIVKETSWYTLHLSSTMNVFYTNFEEMVKKNFQDRIKESPFDSPVMDALCKCSIEQALEFSDAVKPNTIEFIINEEWPRQKTALGMQAERLFEDCTEAWGLLNDDTAFKMTELALKADLEATIKLQEKVEKVLADSEWMKGLVLHRICALAQMQDPDWLKIGEENDKFAEMSSALSVNKVKCQQILTLLNRIKKTIESEQEKRLYRGDYTETQEDPGDIIKDPFFCLDANPEALQSFFTHPHAEMLRKIFEAEGSQDPGPDTTGCPASGGAEGPSQGYCDDLDWNIRLVRSAPALLPRI